MHRDPVDEDMRVLAGRPEEDLQLMRENQHELDLCKQTLIVYRSRITCRLSYYSTFKILNYDKK